MFTLGEKTVNRSKKEQGVHGQTKQWRSHITPLNGIIEVQILEFSSMGLCGCNLKEKLEGSNGTYKGTIWRQIRISRSDDRQKQTKDFSNRWNWKIRGNILCSKRTWRSKRACFICEWDAYHQDLDSIDKAKHLQGAWIWKTFRYCYHLLLEGDLTSNVNVSLLLPIKTSRYRLCSEV